MGEEGAEEGAQEPPVEEGDLVSSFSGVEVVELLVGADSGDVGLGSTGAECDYVEGGEEYGQLQCGGCLHSATALP